LRDRPIIGVVTQTQEAIPGETPRIWIMGEKYVRALTAAGAIPWVIPLLPEDELTLRAIYDRLDGVFLAGGADVDPSEYGEERLSYCHESDPDRDWVEKRLTEWTVADRKPLFGVCRGIQLINVALGGDLYQDLREQRPESIRHDYFSSATGYRRDLLAHPIKVEAGSLLDELLGSHELPVNSMHHQGVRRLASGLKATAFAPDGLVEGFEGTGEQFLLAVQWHPEELVEASASMRRLFSGFIEAARR
jgi:putative glutamine amidotransferase